MQPASRSRECRIPRLLGPPALQLVTAFPVAKSLAGTSVNVTAGGNTVPAPMLFTLASQIAAIMPSTTPRGICDVPRQLQGRHKSGLSYPSQFCDVYRQLARLDDADPPQATISPTFPSNSTLVINPDRVCSDPDGISANVLKDLLSNLRRRHQSTTHYPNRLPHLRCRQWLVLQAHAAGVCWCVIIPDACCWNVHRQRAFRPGSNVSPGNLPGPGCRAISRRGRRGANEFGPRHLCDPRLAYSKPFLPPGVATISSPGGANRCYYIRPR